MPYATVDDLTMYYQDLGASDAPPLILLHNNTAAGTRAWSNQFEAFGAHYRLIVPDMRGHGRTNNPGGLATMNHRRFARDTIGLCRVLGLERALFGGTSSGAMQLLTVALEAPTLVRAMVVSGCAHYQPDDVRAWMRTQTPETFVAPENRAEMQARHTALGPEHWRIVVASFLALADHADAEDYPEKEELRRIQAPTLIVHGDRDFFFPVTMPLELYQLLPNAELCLLPNTGHHPPRERPAWFNPIVLDFLARRAG